MVGMISGADTIICWPVVSLPELVFGVRGLSVECLLPTEFVRFPLDQAVATHQLLVVVTRSWPPNTKVQHHVRGLGIGKIGMRSMSCIGSVPTYTDGARLEGVDVKCFVKETDRRPLRYQRARLRLG